MPFLEKTKVDVVKMAAELGVPLELTWSCYYDRNEQCGKCESCLERREAFEKAGLKDPLYLAS
jgi:7-cyano-7-deazaguanine synthase